ncbi:MAG: hypothetical protein AAF664_10650 [Planctomycetota bacterium]
MKISTRFLRRLGRTGVSALAAIGMCGVTLAQGTGSIEHEGGQYRVVSADSVPTAANKSSVQPTNYSAGTTVTSEMAAPAMVNEVPMGVPSYPAPGAYASAIEGCATCGSSYGSMSTIGGCNSCGNSGYGCGNRVSGLSCQGALNAGPCDPCVPYTYWSIEGLYIEPEEGTDGFIPGVGMGDYDFEFGSRITYGRVYDCVNGIETTIVGPIEWDRGASFVGPVAIPPPASSAFFTPTTFELANYAEELEATYFSADVSRTLNAGEFAKILYGGRYVLYEEDHAFVGTIDNAPTAAPNAFEYDFINSDTSNNLVGGQVGLDLLFPVGRFAFSDTRIRLGAYANFIDRDVQIAARDLAVSASTFQRSSGSSDVQLAGLFELSSGFRYQLGEILAVRAAGELWYLTGVAQAVDQTSQTFNNPQPAALDGNQDIFFVGLSAGIEARY